MSGINILVVVLAICCHGIPCFGLEGKEAKAPEERRAYADKPIGNLYAVRREDGLIEQSRQRLRYGIDYLNVPCGWYGYGVGIASGRCFGWHCGPIPTWEYGR